jgi:general L-amino acid transport system substrate-binding protein
MFFHNGRKIGIAMVIASTCAGIAFPVHAADESGVLAIVRARGYVRCAGIIRPGIAVPTIDGKRWFGLTADVCRAVAAAVFGDPERMRFRPYIGDLPAAGGDTDDIIFVSGAELVGAHAARTAPLTLGPAVVHDAIALLVPERGVHAVSELGDKTVCVEPGSVSDRALTTYFAAHAIPLHEHPFQETDEMRQAYGDGKCDALAGPVTTLASVRADPSEGHHADRILAQRLSDDPIFAATSGDAAWSRIVWWTFSTLVDAEIARIGAGGFDASAPLAGVPPAVGSDLHLPPMWTSAVLKTVGDYATIYDNNLGMRSALRIERGANETSAGGGSIYGLYVE